MVGEVGSGKSSLLAALLGEMHAEGGAVTLAGSVGYTAQDPWIQNATLRNNILMGKAWNEEHYNKVQPIVLLQTTSLPNIHFKLELIFEFVSHQPSVHLQTLFLSCRCGADLNLTGLCWMEGNHFRWFFYSIIRLCFVTVLLICN